jgi:hypothetical protein
MTNLLWKCLEIFGGFLEDIAIAIKVSVGAGDTSIGKCHLWGTISEAGMQFHPCDIPAIAARTVFQDIGIHALFSPQQLECNWLAATSFHGRWDIAFQVPKDLRKYATYEKPPVTPKANTCFGVLETTAYHMRCATCKMDKFYRGSDFGVHRKLAAWWPEVI